MTRQGSLAYYLAAWICGCSFMALAFWLSVHWLHGGPQAEVFLDTGFLALCFLALITGAVPALLFGWLLRRLMPWLTRAFRVGQFWLWIAAGAVLAPVLLIILGGVGSLARKLPDSSFFIRLFLLAGPMTVLGAGIWATLPVGAAAAGVLFAVHRAFAAEIIPER